jgi:hypothetical protein
VGELFVRHNHAPYSGAAEPPDCCVRLKTGGGNFSREFSVAQLIELIQPPRGAKCHGSQRSQNHQRLRHAKAAVIAAEQSDRRAANLLALNL